ncbi:hypothetical protein ACVWXZ_002855, partial [Thermostichus sp. MS-CIW-38]
MDVLLPVEGPPRVGIVFCTAHANRLGCVDLSFEPKESTDEIEKTQEVPGQFVKTR